MPQSIELPTKISKPSRKRLRLPRRLPSQPTVGMKTAPAIMYAVRIHCAWSKLRPKVVIIGGRATFIAEPLTTTRKALSITVAVTHHLYDALSGVIVRLRRGAGTGVGARDAAVGSAMRENAIWSLYIKRQTHARGFYQTIGKIICTVKRKSTLPLVAVQEPMGQRGEAAETDSTRPSQHVQSLLWSRPGHTPIRIFCPWLLLQTEDAE